MKRFVLYLGVLSMLVGVWQAEIVLAVTPGQVDDFQDGTTQGWSSGDPNPNPPVNIPDGGPNGAGDNYLQITSTSGGGPGSKLIVFNLNQWTGDYIAAGVTVISAQMNNLGNTDLTMRLAFDGAGGRFSSADGISLPAGSGWTTVVFPIEPSDLTSVGGSDVNLTLSNVTELRILHNPNPSFKGAPIEATLGVDNIRADEPPMPPGSINGTVTDVTGKPLRAFVIAINTETKEKGKAVTDVNGNYKIPDLKQGNYLVLCIKRGYKLGITRAFVMADESTIVNFELVPK